MNLPGAEANLCGLVLPARQLKSYSPPRPDVKLPHQRYGSFAFNAPVVRAGHISLVGYFPVPRKEGGCVACALELLDALWFHSWHIDSFRRTCAARGVSL